MNRILLITLLYFSIVACKESSNRTEENLFQNDSITEQTAKTTSPIYGNYVDDSYAKRNTGVDWVAILVKEINDKTISISVRSRADKKKPTCTFDTKAYKIDNDSYEVVYNDQKIIFRFAENNITISTNNQEDSYLLNFFCNGGASIAGTYKKINEDLDSQQIDLTSFSKLLNLQDVSFNISSINTNGKNILTIFTFGLKNQEYKESFDIEGELVIDAEVEDLNSDGSPELFVYTQSVGSGSYGKVYAFSVNNRKSMSQVYIQPTAEDKKINNGYMGHDEFSVVENYLVQRFPIYNEGDTNANSTGGTRKVSYKLINGEASKHLVVDKVSEY